MAKRQLSAIMFTDLAGYTAMMQEDEYNAKGVRDKHRKILEEEINNHDGQILQFYGDGALSIFNSTLSASESAISIQSASIENKIPLRIGIHSGDVVIEESGAYGDGVNIASRIESFAIPGSIMISDKVFDDLKNHSNFSPELMGEFELKNVKRPVEVYALTNKGLVIPQRTDLKGKVKERIKSIAVLPFANRSTDPENEYFSDGITEEIITALAKLSGLRVISRTSSFSFKGKNVDIREIGKQLEVQSVLDGSVRKSGNRIRISAQLSSTFDGFQVWSESYDRLLEDIFEVQDEISDKIAQQLKEKLTDPPQSGESTQKIDLDAYKWYLQGLYYYNKWTPSNAKKAIESYQKAIEIEPRYDKAYAGMGVAYSLIATTGFINPKTGFEKTIQLCEKALSINSQNEIAYVGLASTYIFYNWDFDKGLQYATEALKINPKGVEANLAMALYYIAFAEFDIVYKHLDAARNIDPLSTTTNRTLADSYYFTGDYDKALEIYSLLLQRDPDFLAAKEFKGWTLLMMKKYDDAIDIFNSIKGESTHAIKPFVQLGYAYAKKGDLDTAKHYLSELQSLANKNPDTEYDFDFATLYTGLNMNDEALDYLEKCLEKRLGPVVFLNVSPIWEPLKSEKRFKQLLSKVGLIRK